MASLSCGGFAQAALASAKIAVQMGANLTLPEAMMDQLVGAWQHRMVDPLAHVEDYLVSQKGGPKAGYRAKPVHLANWFAAARGKGG